MKKNNRDFLSLIVGLFSLLGLVLFSTSFGMIFQRQCKDKNGNLIQKSRCIKLNKVAFLSNILIDGYDSFLELKNSFINFKSIKPKLIPITLNKNASNRFSNYEPGFNNNFSSHSGFLITSSNNIDGQDYSEITIWDIKKGKKLKSLNIYHKDLIEIFNKGKQKYNGGFILTTQIVPDNKDGILVLVETSDGKNGAVIKLDSCSNIDLYNSDYNVHHSIEIDKENNIYIPTRKPKEDKKYNFPYRYNNEGFVVLDPNLRLKAEYSLTDIFYSSGNQREIFSTGDEVSLDPLHINDVHPLILENGDVIVFLSLRNRSMTMAYNISKEHLIWQLHGASSQQHDITPITQKGDRVIIFDNNLSRFGTENGFLQGQKGNKIIELKNLPTIRNQENLKQHILHAFNFDNDKVEIINYDFDNLSNEEIPRTYYGGTVDFDNKNNILIINESNFGRIFAYDIKSKSIIWKFFNKDKKSNALFRTYSRYVESLPEKLISNKACKI